MYTDRDDQLNQLLRTSIESLDITDQEYELAVARYTAVGGSLKEYWDGSPPAARRTHKDRCGSAP